MVRGDLRSSDGGEEHRLHGQIQVGVLVHDHRWGSARVQMIGVRLTIVSTKLEQWLRVSEAPGQLEVAHLAEPVLNSFAHLSPDLLGASEAD